MLSLFSAALIVTRYVYSGEQLYGWLIWNLFLAWIPFGLAIVIYDRHRAGMRPSRLLPLAALWLLFLPNAPYIITDFKHLVPSPVVPLWVDIVVIAAPAWTGMLLGFLSLYLVQSVVRSLAGPRVAWVTAVAVLGLASFGVYLGRVLRWNSWDVLTHPRLLSRPRRGLRRPACDRDDRAPLGFSDAQLPGPLCVHATRGSRRNGKSARMLRIRPAGLIRFRGQTYF